MDEWCGGWYGVWSCRWCGEDTLVNDLEGVRKALKLFAAERNYNQSHNLEKVVLRRDGPISISISITTTIITIPSQLPLSPNPNNSTITPSDPQNLPTTPLPHFEAGVGELGWTGDGGEGPETSVVPHLFEVKVELWHV